MWNVVTSLADYGDKDPVISALQSQAAQLKARCTEKEGIIADLQAQLTDFEQAPMRAASLELAKSSDSEIRNAWRLSEMW